MSADSSVTLPHRVQRLAWSGTRHLLGDRLFGRFFAD
jgi:hypothetical protein